jgi:CRISPR-associated protein Cas1
VAIKNAVSTYKTKLKSATTNEQLMGFEANFVKALYKACADALKVPFARNHEGLDPLNQHLNSGNYLAYGLAGSALWILGIPHSLPVSHGMTRRGALVFDVADIIKDAFVLPSAMTSASLGETDRAFRSRVTDALHQHDALKILLTTLQAVSK